MQKLETFFITKLDHNAAESLVNVVKIFLNKKA